MMMLCSVEDEYVPTYLPVCIFIDSLRFALLMRFCCLLAFGDVCFVREVVHIYVCAKYKIS